MGFYFHSLELLTVLLLLQAFWQILLLRKSPETIPYSRFLLGFTLILHLLIGISFGVINQPVTTALIFATSGTGLVVSGTYLLLALYGVRSRLLQTVTAMAGCESLIGLMALPVNVWLHSVDKANAALPGMLSLLLLGWNMAVVAHIWRHALSVQLWLGYLYAIGYVIVSFLLASLF